MLMRKDIFHSDFREFPFWWEAYEPGGVALVDVPKAADVVIIGAGYAGLSTALELSRHGVEAVVLDAEDPGYGASTRSGGLVGGIGSVKKPLVAPAPPQEHVEHLSVDANEGLKLLERLIDEEDIECEWVKTGRFTGAWSKKHFKGMPSTIDELNRLCDAGAFLVAPEKQRQHIGSDYYCGGMVTGEAGHLHPALYFKGLLDACKRRDVKMCASARVEDLRQQDAGWLVRTSRGDVHADHVVVATNGYTGDVTPAFQRRLIALQPYIIATEPLPEDLIAELSPQNHSFVDTRRIVSFFRLSGDKQRMIFGSRVKWRDQDPGEMAPALFKVMTDRYPQLKDFKITHAWTGQVALTLDEQPHLGEREGLHFALGCNGSGVAMMTYLGTQLARKIAGKLNYRCAFETDEFPTHPLYNGKSRWFLPAIGNYLRLRDWIDRKTS